MEQNIKMCARILTLPILNARRQAFARAPRRKLCVIGEKGNIEYDFISGMLEIYEAGHDFWKRCHCNEDRNVMFKKQVRHFMDCVRNKSKPLIDTEDAVKTLEFALKIRDSLKG